MSIIPRAALTTVQIVSGLAASAKNAVDLAKSTSNNELKSAVSELYDSVLDVKARVLELDEEVRSLRRCSHRGKKSKDQKQDLDTSISKVDRMNHCARSAINLFHRKL
jgi:predicted metal-dependent peptidase